MPLTRPADILVVDDVPENCRLLSVMLESKGYRVQHAHGGREALAMIDKAPPDLILLDVMMPDMDGYAVTRELKKSALHGHIPIILLTALTDRDSFLNGLNAGAEEFLSKPVDRVELDVRVRNLLRLKEMHDLLGNQNQQLQHQVKYLALYDALTGLPNRRLLQERLLQAMASSARTNRHGALLYIDLDHFKSLNETLGHDKGDQLLQQVSQRLLSLMRESDTVARIGGDEFVLMLENLSENLGDAAAQARQVAEKVLDSFSKPFLIADRDQFNSPSIGIVLFLDHENESGDLLKWADLAMYQAKAAGRNTLVFFDAAMQAVVNAQVALEREMRHALQYNEFVLHYQPQVDMDGRMLGAEALVRWRHPTRGLLAPGEFIGMAETTGLIMPLGQWIMETACWQLAEWRQSSDSARLEMAVNISARQFHDPDFVNQVLGVLERTGANPNLLKLELTESMLLSSFDETINKMGALKARGVCFSLDDFGTGYSSLAYLKRLPLDQLKIDQSFVRDIMSDANDAAIAKTIIALGHSLGLSVIAEGVENQEQLTFLAFHQCHAYQGYFFSQPLPVDDLEAFVAMNC